MSEQTLAHDFDMQSKEYEREKAEKKQKLVRGEFQGTGYFGIPLVKKQNIDIK